MVPGVPTWKSPCAWYSWWGLELRSHWPEARQAVESSEAQAAGLKLLAEFGFTSDLFLLSRA